MRRVKHEQGAYSPHILSRDMTWVFWALLSAFFAAATALLAKVGVSGIDSNLATAIRTSVILVFTWGIALGLEKHHVRGCHSSAIFAHCR
jgi:uncharacterized membrane protein